MKVNNTEPSWSSCQAKVEATKNRKKTTAELLLDFDEEIDRLFLENSIIKPQDRMIHLRDHIKKSGLRIRDDEIRKKIWEGRKRKAGSVEMLTPDMAIDAPEEVWACKNLIMQADSNVLVALPKVGKTTLLIDLIAKWHFGCDEYLGQKFHGKCPPVLIVGTDMPTARWMPLLGRFGLAYLGEDKKWHFIKDGPIKGLFTTNNPLHLDDAGLSRIADEAAKYEGCFLLCDCYAKLVQPFGLSEGDANFAGPIGDLLEAVAPYKTTTVMIHHSGHSRKGQGAVAACRGSTAFPGAVSQIINMRWLRREEDLNDKRVVIETEGRGEDFSIIILQEEERWSLEGDATEVMAKQRLIDVEQELNDTQDETLEEVRRRSAMNVNTSPKDIETKLEISHRQAGRTLTQLRKKGLIIQIAGGGKGKGQIQYNIKGQQGLKGHSAIDDTGNGETH